MAPKASEQARPTIVLAMGDPGRGTANIGASRNAVLLAAKMGSSIAALSGPTACVSVADARRALDLDAVPKAA